MRELNVHRNVTAIVIYPIVLINYASTQLCMLLCSRRKIKSMSSVKSPAKPPVKFVLMSLSLQMLILALVVWFEQ